MNRRERPSIGASLPGWSFCELFYLLTSVYTRPTNSALRIFLAIAAYLIFGSWLNYTRYGARGLDLLPHGDTLRDVPYLMKDLIRRALNTLQSTGSRGGYSAV